MRYLHNIMSTPQKLYIFKCVERLATSTTSPFLKPNPAKHDTFPSYHQTGAYVHHPLSVFNSTQLQVSSLRYENIFPAPPINSFSRLSSHIKPQRGGNVVRVFLVVSVYRKSTEYL